MDVTTQPPKYHKMEGSTNGSLNGHGVSNGVVTNGTQAVEGNHRRAPVNGVTDLPSSKSISDEESPLNPLLQSRVKDVSRTISR